MPSSIREFGTHRTVVAILEKLAKIRRKLSWQAIVGVIVLLAFLCIAILAPQLASHDPSKIAIANRMKPPSWHDAGVTTHFLGTDALGRDIVARLIFGSRVSILVAVTATLVAGSIGVIIGLISGFYGGYIDDVLMRIADVQAAFPFILLAIAVLAVLGPGLVNLILVLGIAGWVPYGRIVRGQVKSLREREFIEAASAIGANHFQVLFRHILPNCWGPVIVLASFSAARTIIAEASLSFLGLGVPPAIPSWGAMLADGREYLSLAPWLATYPGLAIMLMVLSINLLGDWLRDILDPRLRNS